jgi:hypothetical protein
MIGAVSGRRSGAEPKVERVAQPVEHVTFIGAVRWETAGGMASNSGNPSASWRRQSRAKPFTGKV